LSVSIVEVLPRDGLQTMVAHAERVPTTEQKVELIRRLAETGLRQIEITSFAHPKVIPAFADAEEVVRRLRPIHGVAFQALVPNLRGAARAVTAGVTHLACLVAASETYQRKNSNMSIKENLNQIREITRLPGIEPATVTASVGLCFWCPYEGRVPEAQVLRVVGALVAAGLSQVSIADSIGCADPVHVAGLVRQLRHEYQGLRLGIHLHDYTGMALTNAYVALQEGVNLFETSLGGIGGGIRMPIDVRRMGNLATEDLVQLLERCGENTGVDLERLLEVSAWVTCLLGQKPNSRLSRGGTLGQFFAAARRHSEETNDG
jgi:hydroxymethylglutaryl-CoA lyase